jgi:hypothetical protein
MSCFDANPSLSEIGFWKLRESLEMRRLDTLARKTTRLVRAWVCTSGMLFAGFRVLFEGSEIAVP